MALPAGITTATVTVGVPVTFSGAAVRSIVSIVPSAFLIHTASGHPLVNLIEETSTTDGVAAQFTLPHTDQDGFQDESGNAYKNWYYTATIQYQNDRVTKPAITKVFQLAAGQTLVDLDLLPGGSPALPYTAPIAGVTSVNGQTGSVLVEGVSDSAVEALVSDPASATAVSLSATYAPAAGSPNYAGVQKVVSGGTFPKFQRSPVLGIESVWPNRRSPYLPAWVEGSTIYAYGTDSTLRKSTDNGVTWTKRGYNAYGFGGYNSFLKLSTGTLLSIHSLSGAHIQRSTDDGATWTIVHDWRANRLPLGSQSWDVDRVTGYIYYGEYTAGDQTDVNIYRSTDDGATWSVFYTFNGALTGGTGYIRHIHSVQWDHIAQRIVISCGDSTDYTGLWRVNAAGTGVEKIVTNDMLPAGDIDVPRSIGIMPFPDYIAWAGDTTLQPYIFRMARTEIGKPNPVVERLQRLNSAAWFTTRASDDGSRWIISASEEGTSIDNLVHLYAVEDQGATSWEVGAIPAPIGIPAGSMQPVGRGDLHGENLTMITRAFGNDTAAWRFRAGMGVTPLNRPEPLPVAPVTQTASTGGIISLAPSEERIFHISLAGGLARRLHIFEAGVGLVDIGTASAGSLRLQIRKKGAATAYETLNVSERYTSRLDMGPAVASVLFTGGDTIEFVIKNNHTTGTVTCLPTVTFGWGAA